MRLVQIINLPLRVPFILNIVSVLGYCPYDVKRCRVNWIEAPVSCRECQSDSKERKKRR